MSESRPYDPLTVPVASAAAVVAGAASRVPPQRLCDDAGLDHALLRDPAARIPMRALATLYESAARLTGDRAFGLRVGERLDVRHFELLGHILLHSPTLDHALERAARYLPLWTEGASFRHERDARWVWLGWEYADPAATATCQDSEMSVATVAATCRRLAAGAPTGLAEAWFRHAAPRDRGEHARVFGARLRFDMPSTGLLFRRAALGRPAAGADGRLCDVLVRCADAELERVRGLRSAEPLADDTPARVRAWLHAHLAAGQPRLGGAARELGMSPRALQRALGVRGTSYARLLGEVRRAIAERCLADTRLPLVEIAWRLGFSQPNEFPRAFREWTGLTPTRFRELLLQRKAAP